MYSSCKCLWTEDAGCWIFVGGMLTYSCLTEDSRCSTVLCFCRPSHLNTAGQFRLLYYEAMLLYNRCSVGFNIIILPFPEQVSYVRERALL